jgi:hypothetical protein
MAEKHPLTEEQLSITQAGLGDWGLLSQEQKDAIHALRRRVLEQLNRALEGFYVEHDELLLKWTVMIEPHLKRGT